MEILLYRPGDPAELEHDADAAMMQQLAGPGVPLHVKPNGLGGFTRSSGPAG